MNLPPQRLLIKPDVILTIFLYITKVTNKGHASKKREKPEKKKHGKNKLFFF